MTHPHRDELRRIVHLQRGTPDWTGVAAEHGYFDQSHLIHDFRSFAGLTPTAYLRHRGVRVKDHHVALG